MDRTSKSFTVFIILILAISSLIIAVKPANAQSIPKPSVPEFSVKYVDNSYDVPPTYGIDPFTGKSVMTNPGKHITNETVEFTIKNQFLTDINSGFNGSNYTGLLYTFRAKGHYAGNWSYYPFHAPYPSSESSVVYTTNLYGVYTGGPPSAHLYPASDSTYTVVTISLVWLFYDELYGSSPPPNSQIDLQVQALTGTANVFYTGLIAGNYYEFRGEQSDWSNTQTVTIGGASTSTPNPTAISTQNPTPTPTQNPTPTPTVPEFPLWAIPLLLTMAVAAAGLLVYHKKHKH